MKRTCLSRDIGPLRLRENDPAGHRLEGFKPTGFWYEVDGDWRRWCRSESFETDGLFHLHRVELRSCHMRFIDTIEKLDQFHEEYKVPFYDSTRLSMIDWKRVGRNWDGIEIAPYQWERRLAPEFLWYYGWDCASGCIWRPLDASVTYIGPYHYPQREIRV